MKFLEKSNATFVSVLCVGPYGSNQGYCEPPMDASACVSDVIIPSPAARRTAEAIRMFLIRDGSVPEQLSWKRENLTQ